MNQPVRFTRLAAIVQGAHLKYLGLGLVLAWHYCLWFVPKTFTRSSWLDERATFGWLVALACTVVTAGTVSLFLGRSRHLPRSPILIWSVSAVGCFATAGVPVSSDPAIASAMIYACSAAVGLATGLLWVMWGERYACQRAHFSLRHLGPVYGLTLFGGLLVVSVLPAIIGTALVALMPLASGFLLYLSWREAPVHAFPPMLPRITTRQVTFRVAAVCMIAFVAAFVCYFTATIVPWSELIGGVEHSFTIGIGIGAGLIALFGLTQTSVPARPTVTQAMPWLVLASLLACLLCLLNLGGTAFWMALAVSALFEVLIIMFMARLAMSGYAPPATAFGIGIGAIRAGSCLGNGLVLIYERNDRLAEAATAPTLIVFVAILAALLIPLVQQKYSIDDLTREPRDTTEWAKTVSSIAQQFKLSARETEIIDMLGRGYTATAIAERFVISPHTVNKHVQHIYEKIGIHKRSEMLDFLNKR